MSTLGPFVYVPVGASWVRVDQIAAVSDHEVILIEHPRDVRIPLGEDETASTVFAAMRERLDLAHRPKPRCSCGRPFPSEPLEPLTSWQ